jgi:hypothetical protein
MIAEAQAVRALHLLGKEVARLRGQAPLYRALPASHEGERILNDDQARQCEHDADALEAVMNVIVSTLPPR